MKVAISIVILAVLGIVAAGSAAVLTVMLRAKPLKEANDNQQGVYVLVASRDLPALSMLDADAVRQENLPSAKVPPGHFTDAPELIGKVIAVPMKAGQAFTPACFPKPGSGVEVAGLLAPGKRAVSVSLTDYSGIEALLYPGCSVDVLASFTLSPNSKIGKAVSTTLLEKVQVLAVEHITVTSEGSEEKEVTGTASSRRAGSKLLVTLMVDGKQAEALQLASEHGDISLALRNPTDNVNVEEDPTLLNEGQIAQLAEVMEAMVKEQEKAEKAEAAKEPEVASPPPEPEPKRVAATTKRQVTIQVIRGSKSETLSLPIKSN